MEIYVGYGKRIGYNVLMENKYESIYSKLLNESKEQTFKRVEQSRKWFRAKAAQVGKNKIAPTKVISEQESVSIIKSPKQIGSLFFYNYAPKTKKDLEYYDTFPIVFPFKMLRDGFLGLNLHYLPIPYRAMLMDNLYSLLNSSDMTKDSTRLIKLSYSMIESKKQLYLAYPCIHRYLSKNIRTKIAFITPDEWELALFLPLQRFQKQSENIVWKDSILKAKQRKVQ